MRSVWLLRAVSRNAEVVTISTQIRRDSQSDVGVHLHRMSRRTQITLSDRQHAYLVGESARTGLSLAELVRRAVDRTYRPHLPQRVSGFELSLGLWKRPDAAVVGRRRPRRLL
jgi:hypothetical protein